MRNVAPAADVIDIAELALAIRRRWRVVLVGLATGVVAAIGVLTLAPRVFQARASVLIRAANESGGGILSRLGSDIDLLGSGSGLGLGKTAIETEIQVLQSRVLAGRVVDSLKLQVAVQSPRGTAPSSLAAALDFSEPFAPLNLTFAADGNGYHVRGRGVDTTVPAGAAVRLPIGTLTLASGAMPSAFAITVYDREDAIDRLQKRLSISKAGGEVIRISYRGPDSATTAAVPNDLLAYYLERRTTTDRGTNQKRVEFLTEQVAQTAAELTAAERSLRRQQETSGVIDAEEVGRVGLEQAAEIRVALIELEVEEGAVNQMLAQATDGKLSARSLMGYPAFLRSASLNALIGQLAMLDAERLRLLERRTEADPEVVAITQSIASIEGQFLPMARLYGSSLARQRADLTKQVDSMHAALLAIPSAAESGGRLQRDVMRLSQIYTAIQAQLVDARLAAIDEGGDVRLLDAAVAPRKVWFPRPLPTLVVGVAAGLLVGILLALILSWYGRWVRDPREMERMTGVPAQRLSAGAPLLMSVEPPVSRTLLVVPVDVRARVAGSIVAEQLMRTAHSRALKATFLDLSSDVAATRSGNGVAGNGGVGALIDDLERQYGLVVVQLPALSSDAAAAALRDNRPVLLVAPGDRVNRAQLVDAVETLRRMGVPCAGIIIGDPGAPAS